jgi:hypothetical protein
VSKGNRPGWTSPQDLHAQVLRLWQRGVLLAEAVSEPAEVVAGPADAAAGLAETGDGLAGAPAGESRYPLRLTLKVPTAAELSTRYDEARDWIAALQREAGHYRVVFEERRHRQLGSNLFPAEVWLDTREQALAFIRKGKEAAAFDMIVSETRARQPLLLPWLARRPHQALALAAEWSRLLNTVEWKQRHPRPYIYLRQADIPEVDSKFIEQHRGVLSVMLDLALPASMIDGQFTGAAGFERRYGFRSKLPRIRFRLLDSLGTQRIFASGTLRNAHVNADNDLRAELDIMMPMGLFAALRLPVTQVFIIENEIDFLAFPAIAGGLAIFGAGYGVSSLAAATWLTDVDVHYWGDIDTHGFVILDSLRAVLPATRSLLMDRATLLAHRSFWDQEKTPATHDLLHLQPDEASLYDDLRTNQLGERVRLEQERIRTLWLLEALQQAGLQPG